MLGCYQPPGLPLLDEVPLVPKPFEPCAADDEVFVACVIDGDTFDHAVCGDEVGVRVRMLGIDAPETEKPGEPAECWADEATDFLRAAIEGQEVWLTFDRDCVGLFDRTLAYVWLVGDTWERFASRPDVDDFETTFGEGDDEEPAVLLNEVMLGLGYAEQFPEEFAGTLLHQERFDVAAAEARAQGRGLWGACAE
jgi:endonuclease YncB( thermonuclease family)